MIATLALSLVFLLQSQPAESDLQTLVLKNGQVVRAQVLSLEGDRVKLKLPLLGGTADTERSLSDFEPASAAEILSRTASATSFEDQLRVAKFAAEHGLLKSMGRHAFAAKQLAEKHEHAKELVPQVTNWAADALEQLYRQALARRDFDTARHLLKVLLTHLPDERTDAQKDVLLQQLVEAQRRADEEYNVGTPKSEQTREEVAGKADVARLLDPVVKLLDDAQKLNREGLLQSNKPTQARKKFDESIAKYTAAWQLLQKVLGTATDAQIRSQAWRIAEDIQGRAIESMLNAAHMLTARSDYNGATEYVGKVLAMDSENQEAKELRRTIELASSGWGWGWGRPVPASTGR